MPQGQDVGAVGGGMMDRTTREIFFCPEPFPTVSTPPFFYHLVLALCHAMGRHCEGGVRHYLSGHAPAMAGAGDFGEGGARSFPPSYQLPTAPPSCSVVLGNVKHPRRFRRHFLLPGIAMGYSSHSLPPNEIIVFAVCIHTTSLHAFRKGFVVLFSIESPAPIKVEQLYLI